jgi:hypothetical protein
MHATGRTAVPTRMKRVDLASGVGAGILGGGLGALAAQYLDVGPYVAPLIVVGAMLHAWGMFERHRLDAAAPRVWWGEALYWICWAILVAVGVLVLVRS